MRRITFIIILFFLKELSFTDVLHGQKTTDSPKSYICLLATDSILIDGELKEPDWQKSLWTDNFVDILGENGITPKYQTRAKMLWDNKYLYVAAEIFEPHIWATLTDRDAIIYRDNDFEIFIDPDEDGLLYYEIEVNAMNTIMDLLMTKPYFKGGKYLVSLDFQGLKSGIQINGTLNDSRDKDTSWTIEMAIPLEVLCEQFPKRQFPIDGDQWRINFSRVNWDTNIIDGQYVKKNMPEYNWVWSPQGVVDMHRPQQWGYLKFQK